MAREPSTSIFVTGSGRSGTSMVAGLFRSSGLFMGDDLHLPRDANPLGFFESPQVNQINERILLRYLPRPQVYLGVEYGADAPGRTHTWLARIGPDVELHAIDEDNTAIQKLAGKRDFCFKDPRFVYTLPLWADALGIDPDVVCVFRDPSTVVASAIREITTAPYLRGFAFSVHQLFSLWELAYGRALEMSGQFRTLFDSYDAVLHGNGVYRIEGFVGRPLDRGFPRSDLERSVHAQDVPQSCQLLLRELRERELRGSR